MIFTTKAEYGVRLLVELGRQGGEQPVSLKAIAEAEDLPLAYLERIVALLKKAGLVQRTRGAHGGYLLARPAEEITMDAGRARARGRDRADGLLRRRPRRRASLCSHEADAQALRHQAALDARADGRHQVRCSARRSPSSSPSRSRHRATATV